MKRDICSPFKWNSPLSRPVLGRLREASIPSLLFIPSLTFSLNIEELASLARSWTAACVDLISLLAFFFFLALRTLLTASTDSVVQKDDLA
jgi:hypothetical protein